MGESLEQVLVTDMHRRKKFKHEYRDWKGVLYMTYNIYMCIILSWGNHAINGYGGVGTTSLCIIFIGTRWRLVENFTPSRITLRRRSRGNFVLLNRKSKGSNSRAGNCKNVLWLASPKPSHCIDWDIPNHIEFNVNNKLMHNINKWTHNIESIKH